MDDLISRQAVLDLAKDLKFDNVEGLKYYRYRCIDPDAVRELPAVKIEYDVRFADEDHVWIEGNRQYISIRRFQEAVASSRQERKTGFWMIRKFGADAKCSNCGRSFNDVYDLDDYDGFCRHCGAQMKGIHVIKSSHTEQILKTAEAINACIKAHMEGT